MNARGPIRPWNAAVAAGLIPAAIAWTAVGAADPPTVELTIEISGIGKLDGNVAIAVFDSAASYAAREAPIARESVPAGADVVVWNTTVPADSGPLAVMAYHDVNANGRIDFGRFGVPQEPYGFSNNARAVFGPPDFAAASFSPETATRLQISLR